MDPARAIAMLDANAGAPLHPAAAAAIAEALATDLGNPSALHQHGRRARALIERARGDVAAALGVDAAALTWTSGATEANDLGVVGGAAAMAGPGTIAVLTIDHPSLRHAADVVTAGGWRRLDVPMQPDGRVDVARAADALAALPRPWLLVIAAVHHELGAIQPVRELHRALWLRAEGGLRLHVDAAQAWGRHDLAAVMEVADTVAVSGHKIGGPAGVGALWLRPGIPIVPRLRGGQESGLRGGTENILGVVGLGAAAAAMGAVTAAAIAARWASTRGQRDRLWGAIADGWPGARRNGPHDAEAETGQTLSVTLPGVGADSVVAALDADGVCVAAGAACSSGTPDAAPALAPLLGEAAARATVRISLHAEASATAIDAAIAALGRLRRRVDAAAAASLPPPPRRWREPERTLARPAEADPLGAAAIAAAMGLPAGARVAVAMSGGVDSSVVAALLAAYGYEVIGLTARLYDDPGPRAGRGTCCAPRDAADARAVAAQLGIAHHVVDERATFAATVIARFEADLLAARTPNPCVECNRSLKFDVLVRRAHLLGCAALATGHYARLDHHADGRCALRRAADTNKDQAYFLWTLGPSAAPWLRFPLGAASKEQVRAAANRAGLVVAAKPESMDICFLGGAHPRQWLARQGKSRPGELRDVHGNVLGRHDDVSAFTVGQRRGLGGQAAPRAAPAPRFVVETRLDGTVIVGDSAALAIDGLELGGCSTVDGAPPPAHPLQAQLRHRGAPIAVARVEAQGDRWRLWWDAPQPGAAPGQSVVLLDDDRVVGGGVVARALRRGTSGALGMQSPP